MGSRSQRGSVRQPSDRSLERRGAAPSLCVLPPATFPAAEANQKPRSPGMCWEQIRPLESRAGQGRQRVGLAGHLHALRLSVGFLRAQLSGEGGGLGTSRGSRATMAQAGIRTGSA